MSQHHMLCATSTAACVTVSRGRAPQGKEFKQICKKSKTFAIQGPVWVCLGLSSKENMSPLAQLYAQECRTTRSTSKPNSLCCASAAQLIWRCRRRCILGQTEAYLNKVTSILCRQPNHPRLKNYHKLKLPYNNCIILFTNLV